MATAILTPSVQPQAMAAGTPPETPQTAVGVGGFGNVSLYVGDLDSSVNDAQLYDLFNQVGQVVSVRVCRDQARRTSLGYAYVNFSNPQDAVNARELLNFTPINGKPIRIMFSHRDPSIRKSGHANVFIKNLDPSIDNKALHEIFAASGTVLSCKVAIDGNGQSKGYGFVQFDKEESAMNAIKQLDGMLFNDKKVYVGFFVRQQERSRVNGSPKFTNVYVKNLPETTTDDDLNDFFGKYGSITSTVVMRDANGKSKCFGFVNFENPNDAAAAVEKLNGVSLNEKVLYVGKAQRKSEREAELKAKFEQERRSKFEKLLGSNLYMKNLDDDIDDEKLKELFSEFGTVTSCKVMVNPQGVSKGSGFVAFSTPEEATRALTEMNGKMIGRKPLFVAVAERKEDRRARLQAQFAQAQSLGAMTPVPIGMHGFHPGAPRLATHQQLYIGQRGTPGGGGLISGGPQPPAAASYGFQQQLLPGIHPHSFIMPYHQFQRQGGQQPGQRFGSRRGGNTPQMQQQMMYRNSNTGFNRYMSNGRNNMDPSMAPQAMVGPMMQLPLDGSGMPADIQRSGPMPMSTLASALASATPQAQRMMLGEQLFPLVERIERENAGKVTGMLLEMDQTEVLHLIESPDALKKKVGEAMDVLHLASSATDSASDQLGSLSLNE